MKNKIYFLFFFLFLQLGSSQAQSYDNHPWCPPGAQWVYETYGQSRNLSTILSYIGDTVINNHALKIIRKKTRIWFTATAYLDNPPERMYYAYHQDSVFRWEDDRLKLQYVFNTQANQTWILEGDTVGCAPNIPLYDTLVVNDWDTVNLSGNMYIKLNVISSAHWQFGENIGTGNMEFIRNIGSVFSFIPSPSNQYTDCSNGDVTLLNCYYDSLRGYVNLFSSAPAPIGCINLLSTTTTTASPATTVTPLVQLYPNPSQGTAWLSGEDMSRAYVFNALGQLVQELSIDQTPFQWSTQNLQPGLYTVWIVLNNNQSVALKLIKS